MAYQFYIKRFDSAFQKTLKIRKKEWLDCAEDLELKIQENSFIGPAAGKDSVPHHGVPYFSKDAGRWVELLLFTEEQGYGATLRVDFDDAIDTLREIGEYLKAVVYGDEGELYYLPGFGDVPADISIHDIRESVSEPVTDMSELYFKYRKSGV